MCQPKPGPRCSAHARVKYDTAKKLVETLKKEHASNPTRESLDALNASTMALYESSIHYASTPEGYQKFMSIAQKIEKSGGDGSFLEGIAQKGQEMRTRQISMLKLQNGKSVKGGGTNSNHPAIRDLSITLSSHAVKQGLLKGMLPEEIISTFQDPEKVYENRKYENQWRVTGNGICITGEIRGNEYYVRTVYYDRIVTPPRPDQMNNAEGKEFTQRYNSGMKTESRLNKGRS